MPSLGFRAFLHSLNPLAVYREERERDREVLLAVVREASSVLQGATQVVLEQQKLMTQFLGNFQVSDQTTSTRVVTEDQEIERVAMALGMTKDEYLKAL